MQDILTAVILLRSADEGTHGMNDIIHATGLSSDMGHGLNARPNDRSTKAFEFRPRCLAV